MSEYKSRTSDQRGKGPAVVSRRSGWDRLPASIRKREFLPPDNFRSDDWSSWSNQFNLTITWFGYQLAITIASLVAFFTGIGQIFFKLTRQ